MIRKNIAARALGGEVCGDQISCPGPGHSAKDRSLSVKIDPDAPDGFVVNSFASDDPIWCRDYVRDKLGMAPFKPRKRGPSFSARRRAWRDKLMATKVQTEFKIVGYLLSYHANHQTCSTFIKASSIAKESGVLFATVQKAFSWLEKSHFIKRGQRADGAPYATLLFGDGMPEYVFAGGSAQFSRWLGEWVDKIFLSAALTAGDKLVAYTISRFVDPKSGSCNVGYPVLAKAAGVAEKTVQRALKNLRRALFLSTNLELGRCLILTPIPALDMTADISLDIVPTHEPDSTPEMVGPTTDSVDSISHEEGKYISHIRSVTGVDRLYSDKRPCAGWSKWVSKHVWVDRDSPQWHAWQRYGKAKGWGSAITTHPADPSRAGWWFESEVPPLVTATA